MYPLLNNLDSECTTYFYNSIKNNFIFFIALTLFSIDSAYQGTYYFLFDFTCLFYLFIYLFVDFFYVHLCNYERYFFVSIS